MQTKFYSYDEKSCNFTLQQITLYNDSLEKIIKVIKELWNDYNVIVATNDIHTIYADRNDKTEIRIDCKFEL